jgi:hypothetical protein
LNYFTRIETRCVVSLCLINSRTTNAGNNSEQWLPDDSIWMRALPEAANDSAQFIPSYSVLHSNDRFSRRAPKIYFWNFHGDSKSLDGRERFLDASTLELGATANFGSGGLRGDAAAISCGHWLVLGDRIDSHTILDGNAIRTTNYWPANWLSLSRLWSDASHVTLLIH